MSVNRSGKSESYCSRKSLAMWSLTVIAAAGISYVALTQPAQSQISSKVITAPEVSSNTPRVTQARFPQAPAQVELPAPPPIKYFAGLEEPLVAIGDVTAQESEELDAALAQFRQAPVIGKRGVDDYSDYVKPLVAFLDSHPHSNWNAALLTDIGFGYYHAGYFSKAFVAWEGAWKLGRNATHPQARLMIDRAVGELARMHARVGHTKELEALFADIGNRPIGGPATETILGAHEGLWNFKHEVGEAYLCGPRALENVLMTLKASKKAIAIADNARSGPHGVSLTELATLADKARLKYKLIHREPGQQIPVPSVIHWKVNHYAAIISVEDGMYQVQDPTFATRGGLMLAAKSIDAESSGYFLVPIQAMKASPKNGWRIVAAQSGEAGAVYGMGSITNLDSGAMHAGGIQPSVCNLDKQIQKRSDDNTVPAVPADHLQMATACIQAASVSLSLVDTPVGYQPQKGKLSALTALFYNQREAYQPATFSYTNMGQKWSLGWITYIIDNPAAPPGQPARLNAGGGGIPYPAGYGNGGTYGYFPQESLDGSQLRRFPLSGSLPTTSYVRALADGTMETYGLFDGATTFPRKVFLTQVVDPAGNTMTLNYDATFRLTSVVDAMGRSTTFTYGLTSYPLMVTQITDAFGRSSTLTYDTSQRLASITDPVGITSSFTYSTTEPNFVTQLTTPYGTSNFNDTINPNDPVYPAPTRSLTRSDPMGNTDLDYFYQNTTIIPASDAAAVVPSCMGLSGGVTNNYLNLRNSYYWNPHAFALGVTTSGGVVQSEDFTKSFIQHWIHHNGFVDAYDVPESSKQPLENRVWYDYYGSPNPTNSGTVDRKTGESRVLDSGACQSNFMYYTAWGLPQGPVDPLSRRTLMNYAANNIDLLTVQQLTTTPSTYTTIGTYGSYTTTHLPQTYTDAAGKVWNYTYNAAGQLKTITDPNSGVTTYNYDASSRLSTAQNASSGNPVVLTLTYDSADRIRTRTDDQGYVLTYDYDNIDRVTKITYPDATTDLYDYNFQSGPYAGTASQELRKHTDRLGRVTTYGYDAARRLTSVTEPTSGASTRTTGYSYYEDGTLKELTDANGNVTHWDIDIQSRPVKKTYAYGTALAKFETYTYENTTSRLKSITDANGQTKTFTYANDDRVTNVTYTGAINPTPNVTFAWDPRWPRLTSMADGLGTTSYAYTAVGTNGALKLSSIDGPYANDVIGLTYDTMGRLAGRNITGGNETFGYDAISRLTSHVTPLGSFTETYLGQTAQQLTQSVTNGTVTVSTGWGYDTNVNDRRLISIVNSGVTRSYTLGYGTTPVNPYDIMSITDTAAATHPWATQSRAYTYDNVDRLLTASSTTPGNNTYGYDNLDNANSVTTPAGTVTPVPTYNANNQLATWASNSYAYDSNGNTLSGDGTKTYKWDAENRMVEIDYTGTSNKSVFSYDGVGHRISDAETVSGVTTTTRYLWCGSRICQSRDGSDNVLKRYLNEGEYNLGTSQKLVYMPDQLGSVRDAVDATTGTRVASYDYSPYGAVARSSVTNGTDYIYGGLMAHPASGLLMSTTRFYDPVTGRWPTRDPIRESAGPNLYSYVDAAPIMFGDRTGLAKWDDPRLNNPAFTDPIFQGHRTYTPPTCDDPVSIWTCTRGLGGQQGNIPYVCPACHEFVACTDPNNPPNGLPWKTQAFGKQPRALSPDGSSPPGSSTSGPGYVSPEQYGGEPGNFSHCTERKVCPSEQQRQCHAGPTRDPYETGSSVLNCQGWAEGRSQ